MWINFGGVTALMPDKANIKKGFCHIYEFYKDNTGECIKKASHLKYEHMFGVSLHYKVRNTNLKRFFKERINEYEKETQR